jgi:N-acetyl-anhydromuramyl-L-alanine amidase AmpD
MIFRPTNGVMLQALRNSKIRGVQLAIVADNKVGEGNPGYRVRVKFPWLNEQESTFWARIAVPMGGPDRGTYVLPEIDDQVLVVFEHGDINRPIVVGSLWSRQHEPVEVNHSGKNNTKLIKSRAGHRIIFDDKEGAEKLTIVDKTNKNKIVLDSVNKIIKVESDGDLEVIAKANVIMHSNALKIGTSEGVTGKAASLLTHATTTFGLKASSGITIGGGNTTINTANAAATTVSGSGAGELGGGAAGAAKQQAGAPTGSGGGGSSAGSPSTGGASGGGPSGGGSTSHGGGTGEHGGPLGGHTGARATRRLLTVFIQSTFTIDHNPTQRDSGPRIRNGTTIRLVLLNSDMTTTDTGLSAVTHANGAAGQAQIDITGLSDGSYILKISAAAIGQQSTVAAGPDLDPGDADALFRDLEAGFRLTGGTVEADSTGVAGEVTWGDAFREGPLRIRVDWKPDWFRADHHTPRHAGDSVAFIVVHRTVGTTFQATGLKTGNQRSVSVHYLIDKDGHVVKMVKDDEIANQAGDSWYDGVAGLNRVSIGIEHVNAVHEPYTAEQMIASRDLLQALVDAFSVPPHHLVGHVDIAVSNTHHLPMNLALGGRGEDPGPEYDWPLIAAAGLSPDGTPDPSIDMTSIYVGYFGDPDNDLRPRDNDAVSRYGGVHRTLARNMVISELQGDLMAIGYAISIDPSGVTITGNYDTQTARAVERFRMRFSRFFPTPPAALGLSGTSRCDATTAQMIKTVRNSLP